MAEPEPGPGRLPGDGGGRAGAAAAGRPRRRTTLRETFIAFEQRDFRFLGLSTLALGFGQWAQQLGLQWLVLELTGSPAQIGLLAAFQSGIGTASAPIGGLLADRYSRRMVIVWTTIAAAAQAAALAVLVVMGNIQIWQVYALALAGGLLQSLTNPARQAFVYDVSTPETLPNAITMNSIIQNVARVSAPPLVGGMIGFFGLGTPFVFLAVTKVIAAGLTLFISSQTRQERITTRHSPVREIIEGFVYTWRDRRVLGLMVAHTIPSLLVVPYLAFIAVVSKQVLGKGAEGAGLMLSMAGWGSILGLSVLALLRNPRHKGWLMLGCFLCYTTVLFGFAQSRSFVLSLAFLAASGIFSSVAFALNNVLLQLATRNEVRGRVMAVWQLTAGLQPLGALPMGLLIARYGVQVGIGSFMAVALATFVLFTLAWASVRRM